MFERLRRLITRQPRRQRDRYDGRSLVRLVELYALGAIDFLSPTEARTLQSVAASMHASFKTKSTTWPEVLEERLQLPARARDDVKTMWREWQVWKKSTDADAFAREYADELCKDVRPD